MNIRKIQSKAYLSILLLLLPLLANAQVKIDSIWYNLDTESMTAEVIKNPLGFGYYLSSVTIPSTVTHEDVLYNVTRIGNNAFKSGVILTSITIPACVTSIGDEAFYECSNLVDVSFSEGVTSIGKNAFYQCSSLTEITIPASVMNIGFGAFSYCSGLTSISVDERNTAYDSRENCNAIIKTSNNSLIAGCSTTTIPESVTSIGGVAFANFTNITEITIPANVTSIGPSAFYNCKNLSEITIPANVESIGRSAFEGTPWLNNQSEGIVYVGKTLYAYKGSMPEKTSIDVREGTKSITDKAFYEQENLSSITIPASVTEIGDEAFNACSGLAAINVAEGNIVYDSREGCNAIIETNSNALLLGCSATIIPEDVTSIGNAAFWGCSGLSEITIPASVKSIGAKAFQSCRYLTSVVISEGVDSIGDLAFSSCNRLNSIILPTSIKDIGNSTFLNCSNLTSIVIPEGVAHITDGMFYGCANLNEIIIPEGVKSIGWNAFRECVSLREIIIPSSVTSIGNEAFYGCSNLTNITIPKGVKTIWNETFRGCSSLASIILPEGMTSIGESALYGCISLTEITIPYGVTSIGESAFYFCNNLTSITIPASVTNIASFAFNGCRQLREVYCHAEELPSMGAVVFYLKAIDSTTLHVPTSALETYKTTAPWSSFGNIVAIEEPKPYLVTEGKEWAICTTGAYPAPNSTTFTYRLQGDTIIDGKRYLVEYESNDIHLTDWKPSGHFMREEDGKVYRKHRRQKETILLDYGMQVGDTLRYNDRTNGMGNIIDDSYTYVCLVGVRDTILPNGDGVLRGCYDAVIGEYAQGEYHSTNWGATFVEDIGWLDTGLSDEIFFTSGCGKELLYVKQDNTMLYQKEKGVYWKGDHVMQRPVTRRGYGLYHGDSYLYAYTMDEAAGVTDSTDFARWNDREVIRIDVDTIGPNAFSGATFRQGQIICFTERLNTIFKDAFTGINILPRSTQDASLADDLTLVFEGNRPPLIDKNQILDYADSTCRINYAVPDIATYVASDIQWAYTTLMTIEDLLRGYISPENEVTVSDSTEVNVVVDENVLGPTGNGDLVVTVEARPRKDIPVRIGDGENKDIYSRAPAWQRYTMELKVTDSQETVLFEDAQECNAEEGCVFEVVLSAYPEDGVVYLHSRSVDMFNRSTEWSTRTASLTGIEQVEVLDQNAPYYDLQGRPVVNPTRGIYIKDGNKVVIK